MSFRELPPRETGGIENRQGIEFQDHVAAHYCLQMLQRNDLLEVWCETHDDIVLVWHDGTSEIPEYVQVKGAEVDQLWTSALLCGRDSGKADTSILEKSLANDRATEEALFRLVSYRQISKELGPLRDPRSLDGRPSLTDACRKLEAAIRAKLTDVKSPNGRGIEYWLARCLWESLPQVSDLHRANTFELMKIFEDSGFLPAPDGAQEVYARLLRKVQDAASAPAALRLKKTIERETLREWLSQVVSDTKPSRSAGLRARAKLERAGVDEAAIAAAQEQRLFYRKEVLRPQYLSVRDRGLVDVEVSAVLLDVRARLDIGSLTDDGVTFHARCLAELAKLQETLLLSSRPPLALLHGRMYDLTDRCLHRFTRAQP